MLFKKKNKVDLKELMESPDDEKKESVSEQKKEDEEGSELHGKKKKPKLFGGHGLHIMIAIGKGKK